MRTRSIGLVLVSLVVALLTACAHTGEMAGAPVLDRIQERGELVVGTSGNMPPLNMTTKRGDIIGFEADLARYMAGRMGVKLKLETMPFADLLPALEQGKVDMVMSGMTMTPKRNLKAAFVGPYLVSGKAFLTKRKTIASIEDTTEIDSPNTRLAALKGSTSEAFVKHAIPRAKLTATATYDEAVNLVLKDEVHALVADYPICVVSLLRNPGQGLVSVITPLTYEPVGVALPPGDPLLVNWVENLLGGMAGSGELDALKSRWIEDASWLRELQ